MGARVSFAGVGAYADGTPIRGLFDRTGAFGLMQSGVGGTEVAHPELRVPFNAFDPMPKRGQTITIDGTDFKCEAPLPEDDGAFLCYQLKAVA